VTTAREEAARWFARLQGAGPDHPDRGRFEAWLAADPAHAAEYAAIADVWSDFESPQRLRDLAGAMERESAAAAWRSRERRKFLKRGTLAVALTAGAGAAGLHGWQFWQGLPVMQFTARTGTGETGRQELPDGSRILLGADTRIEVAYSRNRRSIILVHGDAIFDVAHDPDRPFVVEGGLARATVLGTRFAVNRGPSRLRVSVERGRVQVDDGLGSLPILLEAGQVAEVDRGTPLHRLVAAATDGFAWQRGMLVFDDATLEEIAASLSRYRRVPVRVVGATGQRVTAVVQSSDIEYFLQSLPSVARVGIEEHAGETLILAH
jgi:transmembrane sensor